MLKNSNNTNDFLKQLDEYDEKRLQYMLNRPINTVEDAYENIIELERFIKYPHDNLQNVVARVHYKYNYICEKYGVEVLENGMKIYERNADISHYLGEEQIVEEILTNPVLSERLNYYRYHIEVPVPSNLVKYLRVYSYMVEQERIKERDEELKKGESKR